MASPRGASRLIAFALLVVAQVALAAPARAVEVGERAPDIGLEDFDGRVVSLSRMRGRVVIVDVWASWCGPCREELPALQRLHARYYRRGLRVVGVSVDRDEAAARDFIARSNVRFRNVHDPDGRTPRRYGLGTMPSSWIIDHRGIVRHVTAGFRAGDAREMERVVSRLLDDVPSRAPTDESDERDDVAEPDVEDGDAQDRPQSAEAEEADEAEAADGPPAASRSEAGRSGGLCSVGAEPSPAPGAFFGVLVLISSWRSRQRRRRRRRAR